MEKLSFGHVFLWVFSVSWTIAMIRLWEWNVEGTGWWFALLMILLGVIVHFATWAHYLGWGKCVGDFLRKHVFYRDSYRDIEE
jgi:hypothetical protein